MFSNQNESGSIWAPLSDIMTGLMVIFLFIAIAYILESQKKQVEKDLLFKDFQSTKELLYHELDSTFRDDFKKWEVELDKDLSIKFTNPEILFPSGQARIRSKFQQILNSFVPRYLDIILQKKYTNQIAEIRIEGHTDPLPMRQNLRRKEKKKTSVALDSLDSDLQVAIEKVSPSRKQKDYLKDPYIGNVKLSQDRARNVLAFIRKNTAYKNLSESEQAQLQFWFTANGFSYGRTLDKNKNLTFETGNPIDNKNSRRVEFRIITSSNKLIEQVIENLK